MDIHCQNKENVTDIRNKCYRRMRVKWTQKITNDTIVRTVGGKETIMQKAIRQRMGLFGHVARMGDDRKLNTVVFGVLEETNKRARGLPFMTSTKKSGFCPPSPCPHAPPCGRPHAVD